MGLDMKLADIHLNYDTDKGTDHSYIDTYDELFAKFQDVKTNILEIGCLTCGSLKMFEEYFSKATIYGIDNWQQSTNYKVTGFKGISISIDDIVDDINNNHSRIKLVECDSTDIDSVRSVMSPLLKFSVIIDDSEHIVSVQFANFKNFIKKVKPGGYYIVEDAGDWNILEPLIQEYIDQNELSFSVRVLRFGDRHRSDNNLIVLKSTAEI